MLLIQKFAELCHSTTQTLRYYDKEDVLKPYYIEETTRYRYYLEEQAFDFFKIKRLQEAGFSLEEIKGIKDKSDDEIIKALNDKQIQFEERIEKIINLKETYLNEKMKLENMIEELAFERLNVTIDGNLLILTTQHDQFKLKCRKPAGVIAKLLNEMQSQVIIGLDSLQDFKKYENALWDFSEIYTDWQNADEMLDGFKPITGDYSFAIHLFNINHNVSLYDVNQIICTSDTGDAKEKEVLFNVSLSENNRNSYAMLYVVSSMS